MGHFDRSICNCCVCPMQCVLKQLMEQQITIDFLRTTFGQITIPFTINRIEDFIVFTDQGNIAICQIVALGSIMDAEIKLKPIRKDFTGECVCCEDPMTNLLNSMKKEKISIPSSTITEATIEEVGEGIVLLRDLMTNTGAEFVIGIASTCQLDIVAPPI
ncbi:hypothetical protein [Chengkuizengella marina]|uniref:Uncharacterized protein n=1 Tax=Chengkuizengella marina TaxID=2507566 RepID=A0A6N9Q916_9BACL|nr:hypothetical protein [Chengkuizengella marina]NBI31210.1 hypothetical protein [Chengkuizengella marina]